MKTLFATLAAVAAVTAVAAPAAAQPRDHDRYERSQHDNGRHGDQRWDRGDRHDQGYASARVRTAERRIEAGLRSGQLTRQEGWQLRAELRDFARLEARARYNGVSGRERAQIERRWSRLIAHLRYEKRDREYGYGYGYRR